MSKTLLLCLSCIFLLFWGHAQPVFLKGLAIDAQSKFPVEGVSVLIKPLEVTVVTDENGVFQMKPGLSQPATIIFSAIGYTTVELSCKAFLENKAVVFLSRKSVQLNDVVVSGNPQDQYKPISTLDIKLRGINNSQEILRMVPGLFIGQHAGGGKAEQIFLRGFDIDHGTDISIGVDGMPVNMVSHAHGQGYADLHFVIPELIENVSFKKGTYYADKGNFTTSGFVDFKTYNVLPENTIKLEGGMFDTYRALAMINLLGEKQKQRQQSAYIASEYMYTNGYFDHPQSFNRFNIFGKYYARMGSSMLSLSASTFTSRWDASGQIPDRAVADGSIGFYGAIDPFEGGNTSRTNVNFQLHSLLSNGATLKNQLYYSNYHFKLFSNFTFFKEDPINGDQIRQAENRNLAGYNGSYTKVNYAGAVRITSEVGANFRMDFTRNSELSRTIDKNIITDPMMLGNIGETNLAAYITETVRLNERFSINGGLRYDYFFNTYTDKLQNNAVSNARAGILSPKLNFYYHLSKKMQLYLTSGRGFHSNDTRVVVAKNGLEILPAAYGSDLGTILKPANNLLINAAIWYLWLQQEFVYVGDEGVVEPSGKSRRLGFDVSARYQPLQWLYLDVDFNYSNGRATQEPKGMNYLPLAPVFTRIAGATIKTKSGINGSLRYRYMGNRPANADNTVIAKGYFVTDAVINYQRAKYEIALSIQNLFNIKWKETQFDTESRLYNEPASVSEIHFTPGTPFFAKLGVSYKF